MTIFKFIIPVESWIPIPSHPGLEAHACLAVVEAETEAEARAVLAVEAAKNGYDLSWLEVAAVRTFAPATKARVLAYVEGA